MSGGKEPAGLYAVAVIDVLGYKNLRDDPERKARIDHAIAWCNNANQYPLGGPDSSSGMVVSAIAETDSIVITWNFNDGNLFADAFWGNLFYICHYMMFGNYLVRGGVGFGYVREDALQNAKAIEQGTRFPRIAFQEAPDAFGLILPHERLGRPKNEQFRGLLHRQNLREFDFLRYDLVVRPGDDARPAIVGRLRMVKQVILNGLQFVSPIGDENATQTVRNKYRWYRKYYNEVAGECGEEAIPIV